MNQPAHETELFGGQSYFDAMLRDIEAAQREIRIEAYTFRFDHTGTAVLDALERAAARGVDVYMVVDGLGSPEMTVEQERAVAARGIRVLTYRRLTNVGIFDRVHGRLHRKLAVFDRSVLFIGGLNIADQYADKGPECFFDLAVRVRGPVAEKAAALTEAFYESARLSIPARWRLPRPRRAPRRAPDGSIPVEFVVRDNHRNRRAIERSYRAAIRGSRRTILLAHAYFLPSRAFINELLRAARRGVEIDLMVQGKAEHRLLQLAQVSVYHRLHAAGVRIHEYRKRLLHTKVAVVDSEWVTIGSSNLDLWSGMSNLEANVNLVDGPLASKIEELLCRCRKCDCERFEPGNVSMVGRWISYAANRLMRLVFVVTGGRRNLPG